jgi:hypothetical protein
MAEIREGTRERERKHGPAEFRDHFTIFPDSGITELHCFSCDMKWAVGWHPSLDVLIEQARQHNRERHGGTG